MTDTSIDIRVLGELAGLRNGEPVPLPQSKKTRALLAYLLLNDRPQRRDHLCEVFWQIPDDPRGSLRWSLSKLRSVLNDEACIRINADREHVSIDRSTLSVDFLQVQETCTEGFDHLNRSELSHLSTILSGNALEGLDLPEQPDFENWRLAQVERAREFACGCLQTLIGKLDDHPTDQAKRLRELVQIDRYNGDAHQRLVKALAASGRRKEAEAQVEASSKILGEIDDTWTQRLHQALRQKPVARTPDAVDKHKSTTPTVLATPRQEIRFCKTTDDVQLAYATVGSGAPLVKAANWLNHLEFDWESPVWRHLFSELSADHRFIRYDARGNGLSDWTTDDYSFESMVRDLETVVDALELDTFPLLGLSQGCAVSIEYAIRHPEKVTKLILYGGYARGRNLSGSKAIMEQTDALETLVRLNWGSDNPTFRQMFTSFFMPDAPPENHEWFNELQRMTTTPENAANLMAALRVVDIRDRLAKVNVPTLVMHARGELMAPVKLGREMATGIPQARFVELDTRNHLIPESDPAWPKFISEIKAFLAE